ncbi:MAG TPA: restriction endonuclease [Pyrinomonadaceae bacterium]|jgi:DNA-directed RNA polymerase subunit N (RpoN/RPB10)
MKSSKWKKFEKVAAAVRRLEQDGSSIKWNSRVAGNRFDAVIRSAYEGREFLIVVDCVDCGAPVTAAVEAFSKKVAAAGADLGIMASASEYTEDAFKLSADHPAALLTREAIDRSSEERTFNAAAI